MRLLLRVFKQVVESTQCAGAFIFLPPHLVNPSVYGGGGVRPLIPLGGASGVLALIDTRLGPPLSLGELDDFDSRVCGHVHSRRHRGVSAGRRTTSAGRSGQEAAEEFA